MRRQNKVLELPEVEQRITLQIKVPAWLDELLEKECKRTKRQKGQGVVWGIKSFLATSNPDLLKIMEDKEES